MVLEVAKEVCVGLVIDRPRHTSTGALRTSSTAANFWSDSFLLEHHSCIVISARHHIVCLAATLKMTGIQMLGAPSVVACSDQTAELVTRHGCAS